MIATILIELPAVGSANVIEILWTFFGVAGLCIVGPNIWATVENMDVLVRTPPAEIAAAKIILRGRVRRELLRIVKLLIIVVIGVYAMATPPVFTPEKTTIAGLLITIAFLVISALISAQSLFDRRESQAARKALAERNLP